MKFFEKNSLLDEMQEKKQLKIESRGYWLIWGALFVALMVQTAMDAPPAQYIPELLIFLGISLYNLICSLRSGIWDRHFIPTTAGNVLCSLAGGAFIMVYIAVKIKFSYADTPLRICLAGGAIGCVFTAALIFILLQISLSAYNKRHKQLEAEDDSE